MGSRANAEKQTVAAMEKAGVKSFADLQALPADQVAKLGRGQGLIVDGWIVPEDQSKTFAEGRQNKVPVLVGSNKERLWRRLRSADDAGALEVEAATALG